MCPVTTNFHRFSHSPPQHQRLTTFHSPLKQSSDVLNDVLLESPFFDSPPHTLPTYPNKYASSLSSLAISVHVQCNSASSTQNAITRRVPGSRGHPSQVRPFPFPQVSALLMWDEGCLVIATPWNRVGGPHTRWSCGLLLRLSIFCLLTYPLMLHGKGVFLTCPSETQEGFAAPV